MKYKPEIAIAYFRDAGLPTPVTEHRFHPKRRWRFDFAWVDAKIALEVEGGVFTRGKDKKRGAHGSITGILRDIEKYNDAAAEGWRVLRVVPDKLLTKDTVAMLKRGINNA